MCGGIFGGAPSMPAVTTPDDAKAQRDKDEADAKMKARIVAANATGRRSLLNPTTGAAGVTAPAQSSNPNSLY